ncbi:hypothetical protein FHR83_001734 [Actinoplanes campanulatus]|uniref:Guanylate cyclase domain-containing protein n=1 Tax=Actinoplanes campanulatus TaxID=113559 RepID=A0A7W5ADQ7_9ACTN|nr:hypothetical protein [Actinoplanes campanulatus]MBB3094085.1 hypothetical protein [Actinoplanes campanulatus]GGN32920.1 hypothetical protein GCM10010109_54420 [Actinoplanes campanulatus]GID38217.1 hypothetical protein Aca09nite_47230 [Actinoplanes campanulatus]
MTISRTPSRPLPPYRAILAVDAKDFTKLPASAHEDTSVAIKSVVGSAMRDAGLEADWVEPFFFGDTGDGFAVGLPTRILPFLIDPFPVLLQDRLAQRRNEHPGEVALRLRVSLHVGPLPVDSAAPSSTGNGAARNDTHRLLDADVIKEALRDVSPEIALVAMIISERVYDDVVRGRYAGLHPDNFVPVTARVAGKSFDQPAWLHLPAQPGRPFESDPTKTADPANHTATIPSSPFLSTNYGQVAQINHGGMHQGEGATG